MENLHTKGDWELRGNRIFIKGTYKSIATIEVQNNFDIVKFKSVKDIEQIANSNLILNSPDLLNVCKMNVDAIDLSQLDFYNKWGFNVSEVILKTRQIIEKTQILN